ncbi:MAG TPA: hypothetical protein VN026_17165 [Bacteroidia bacterium]|jgi:hypothetical protein|nr:hypothetical protein [Bacteroidia bacterium]
MKNTNDDKHVIAPDVKEREYTGLEQTKSDDSRESESDIKYSPSAPDKRD